MKIKLRVKGLDKTVDAIVKFAKDNQKAVLEALQEISLMYFKDLANLVSYSRYSEADLAAMGHPLAKRKWARPLWDIPPGGVQTVTGRILETLRMGEIRGRGYWVGWRGFMPDYLIYVYGGTEYMFARPFLMEAYNQRDYDKILTNILKRKLRQVRLAKK
jgi:hypothetical protein